MNIRSIAEGLLEDDKEQNFSLKEFKLSMIS